LSARLIDALVDFLLPQPCFLCGANSAGGPLCKACAVLLPEPGPYRCRRCALPTFGTLTCGRCISRPPAFDASVSAFEYRFPVSDMIRRLKYHGDIYLAKQLGRMLVDVASVGSVDVIVPMPLHRRRLGERGFNQALELARPLARASGLPMLVDAVVRERDTSPQAGLSPAVRKRNLRGAFGCTRSFAGLSVLVVDDVMTTGATAEEFARTLRSAGARRVENLILARTLPGR